MNEWIDVNDKLPEKSGDVLVYTKSGLCRAIQYSKKWKAFNASDILDTAEYAFNDVTHWMPLPEAPKEVA